MKRENSNLEVQTTLDARPGQLPALERWLQLNGESFRRWPGLTNIEWARVPGRESISLRLAYASFPALERNYERWAAAAEMMERTLLARAPSEPSVSESATSSPSITPKYADTAAADELGLESPSGAWRSIPGVGGEVV